MPWAHTTLALITQGPQFRLSTLGIYHYNELRCNHLWSPIKVCVDQQLAQSLTLFQSHTAQSL